MDKFVQIDANFIEKHCNFNELIPLIEQAFAVDTIQVPQRHHHDYYNPESVENSTLLLMPAFQPGQNLGVKLVTINPNNQHFDLPSIQGTYMLYNANNGIPKAMIEAKSLTVKRTAATSALASKYLSRDDSNSLLMIGTGALSTQLIKAHAAVRPIKRVYVWGRNFEKAQAVCHSLNDESFDCSPVEHIEDKISEVDIVSCATLSKIPLVLGEQLVDGQHLDLVGAYKPDMREADDNAVKRSSFFVDTFHGIDESGETVMAFESGALSKENIKADLFQLCSGERSGRATNTEITLFKSVGYALEDLIAANYFYNSYINA